MLRGIVIVSSLLTFTYPPILSSLPSLYLYQAHILTREAIHSVDKVHTGTLDSSVLYIPVCPTTTLNATYIARQRAAFRAGTPGPDFPGGVGEREHVGRPTEGMLKAWTNEEGRRAFGLERLEGGREVVGRANEVLGF